MGRRGRGADEALLVKAAGAKLLRTDRVHADTTVDAEHHYYSLRTWYALRSQSRWEGADMEAIGMVYSSRSARASRAAARLR